MSTDEPRGDMVDQAEISIMAAERAAIEAVLAARQRRLEERSDAKPAPGDTAGHHDPTTHDVDPTSA
jgi:hypothetical protein